MALISFVKKNMKESAGKADTIVELSPATHSHSHPSYDPRYINPSVIEIVDDLDEEVEANSDIHDTPHGKLVKEGKLIEAGALVEGATRIVKLMLTQRHSISSDVYSLKVEWVLEDGTLLKEMEQAFDPTDLRTGIISEIAFEGEGPEGSLVAYARRPSVEDD